MGFELGGDGHVSVRTDYGYHDDNPSRIPANTAGCYPVERRWPGLNPGKVLGSLIALYGVELVGIGDRISS